MREGGEVFVIVQLLIFLVGGSWTEIRRLVLNILNLRYLVDIQVEMSNRQLDI